MFARCLVVLSLLVATVAHAGDAYVPPDFLTQPPTLPADYEGQSVLKMDLDDALMIALRQNLDLAVDRKQLQATKLSEQVANIYEPTLSVDYSHGALNQPPPTIQAGMPGSIITSHTDGWDASISQKLPTGGSVSLGLQNTRIASSSGTAVDPLYYSSTLSFQFVQPLLRGFSTDLVIPQYSQITARIATEQQKLSMRAAAATLVQQTEGAYWDVVLALYSYDVTAKSQKTAEDTVELVRRQIAAGLAPPGDLTGAENTFAERKLELISAEQTVEQSWDKLRTVIALPRDQWSRPVLPTEHPKFHPDEKITPEQAFETATAHRPEIASTKLDLESSELAIRKAKNDALPQIDLSITSSVFGQSTTYSGALSELGSHDATGWGVMLGLSWTPLQRASKANIELARIQHEVREMNRDEKVQAIWNDVREAVRAQKAAALEVVAASRSRTLASQTLEIETKKYVQGSSSNLDVATRQTGLAQAELAELRAVLRHERVATDLLLATGQLLDSRHIKLEVMR